MRPAGWIWSRKNEGSICSAEVARQPLRNPKKNEEALFFPSRYPQLTVKEIEQQWKLYPAKGR